MFDSNDWLEISSLENPSNLSADDIVKTAMIALRIFHQLLIGVASTLACSVYAQQCPIQPSYVVGFFNGIGNSRYESQISILELRIAGPKTFKERTVSYSLFYNPTAGYMDDVTESFKQLELRYPELKGRYDLLISLLNGLSFLPFPGTIPTAVLADFVEESVKASIGRANPTPVVDSLANQIRQKLGLRQSVLAVAHSQGNLFLNAVMDKLGSQHLGNLASIRTVHVATPDKVDGPYTTNSEDKIINTVRRLLGAAPDWNITIPNPYPPTSASALLYTGHFFVEDYLRDGGRVKVVANVLDEMDLLLPLPCPGLVLALAPSSPSLAVGETLQLTATATDLGGATVPAPVGLQWSAGPNVVIDQTGRVSGLYPGDAVVQVVDLASNATAQTIVKVTLRSDPTVTFTSTTCSRTPPNPPFSKQTYKVDFVARVTVPAGMEVRAVTGLDGVGTYGVALLECAEFQQVNESTCAPSLNGLSVATISGSHLITGTGDSDFEIKTYESARVLLYVLPYYTFTSEPAACR